MDDAQILHDLDFKHGPIPCETLWCKDAPNEAEFVIKILPHLEHMAEQAHAGEHYTVCKACWQRTQQLEPKRCACGQLINPKLHYWIMTGRVDP